jgi:hypothetical protein
MKALCHLFSAFLFVSASTAAFATDVGYEVEVIIFEDTTGVYNYAENWSLVKDDLARLKAEEQAKQPADRNKKPATAKHQAEPMKAESFRLKSQAEKLLKHPDYRLLLHTAWKQPGLDRDLAFAVHVDSKTDQTDTRSSSHIAGDITLVMSRYLHVNADLQYQKPGQPVTAPATANQPRAPGALVFSNQPPPLTTVVPYESYPVMFERRMRSREIHYLDHPLVGMIVLATPFKIESKAPGTKPGGYQTL